MDERKPGYYAVIPAQVRYDTELRPNAKLLYGELTALAGADGYCWASDKYFAGLFGLSANTINELIQSLKKKGYIRVEMSANHKGPERHIYAGAFVVIPEKEVIPKNPENPAGGYPEKSGAANPEKSGLHKDNNINITKDPLPPKGENSRYLSPNLLNRVREYAGEDGALLQELLAFAENRWAMKKPLKTDRALTLLLNKLDRLSGGDAAVKMSLIDKAIENGWLSFYPLRGDGYPAGSGRGEPAEDYVSGVTRTW